MLGPDSSTSTRQPNCLFDYSRRLRRLMTHVVLALPESRRVPHYINERMTVSGSLLGRLYLEQYLTGLVLCSPSKHKNSLYIFGFYTTQTIVVGLSWLSSVSILESSCLRTGEPLGDLPWLSLDQPATGYQPS